MRWLALLWIAACGGDDDVTADAATDAVEDADAMCTMFRCPGCNGEGTGEVKLVCPGRATGSCRPLQCDAGVDAGDDPDAPDAAAECSCDGGCGEGERCMRSQTGGPGLMGFECSEAIGLGECRAYCGEGAPCSGDRPHCATIRLSVGCCSEASEIVDVCCANDDATSVEDCR